MADPSVNTYNFTTGPTTLPDVGTLSYNGCVFSPLFATQVSGNQVKDQADRTVKYTEYTIKADGYVTLPQGSISIAKTMSNLRTLLSAQGGALSYQGRGCDINVNNGADLDVAWGPKPEVLEFQPLGGGLSAKIVWQCKVSINEQKKFNAQTQRVLNGGGGNFVNRGGIAQPMLQFNYGTSVTYGEDGFSKLDISGTLEIPLTRTPNQKTLTLQQTADDLRSEIDRRVMSGIDLNKFRDTNRRFDLSRDKRTLEWQLSFEELPYMQMPSNCTLAHGTYSVRPVKAGYGLVRWLCNLRATYTVRADKPRRTAWTAFLALMRLRMSFAGDIIQPVFGKRSRAMLMDFNVEEGLYLDSKTISFSAGWTNFNTFQDILKTSGIWRKVPERPAGPGATNNFWAISMKDVEGSKSWLPNTVDASKDLIVDFGS